jgi:hypothetical protein
MTSELCVTVFLLRLFQCEIRKVRPARFGEALYGATKQARRLAGKNVIPCQPT